MFFNTCNRFVALHRFLVLEDEVATESYSRTGFPVLDNEPKFNNAGTVLATECRLLLSIVDEDGQNPQRLRFSSYSQS